MTLGGVLTGALGPYGFLNNPPGTMVVRPNTPVLPFAATLATTTFIDPSATIIHGEHIVVGSQTFIGQYSALDATTGFIKIGSKSDILANATIVSNPTLTNPPSSVEIGDDVSIGYGAFISGPAIIGAYGTSAKPTGIGANAVVINSVIEPGAIVGPLAHVGPYVTIPSGFFVLPGASVTTQAEASNPALGKVEKIPTAVSNDLAATLARSVALAAGYTNLYQGNSATGANIGTSTAGIFHGNLATVEGVSAEPGNTTTTAVTGIAFEPSAAMPKFTGPHKPAVAVSIPSFKARIIGGVVFDVKANVVQNSLGARNVILGDQGQPITFNGAPVTGNSVTIASPLGGATTTTTTTTVNGVTSTKTTVVQTGTMTIGANFQVGSNAVVLGGTAPSYTIGSNVSIGSGAVVSNSSLGSNVSIGAGAYVTGSALPAGTVVPAGAIIINNVYRGQVGF